MMYRILTTTAAAVLAALLSCTLTTAYNLRAPQSTGPNKAAVPLHKLNVQPSALVMPRRAAVQGLVTGALGLATAFTTNIRPSAAAADAVVTAAAPSTDSTLQNVYFGVGCYWHIQHEFVTAEIEKLGRSNQELTAYTGYAGGKSTDKEGRVCYHNRQGVADYGKLGHGEVVGMTLPADKIVEFSALYFSLFNPKTKDRVDPGDRGGEYRSLMGIPGGLQSPAYPGIQKEAEKAGFTLVAGKGNDPDTLGKQIIYVHDTAQFPFYRAEVYHQYHDDFQSPPYGKKYNQLADLALEEGRISPTGCPDRV